MKKTCLLCLGLLAYCFGSIFAQSNDPNLIMGQLENGLTYYIRSNKYKANRANFYIVQKVGSVLEEEDQRGLAHFLEHMAFNGTKHFPRNKEGVGIKDYLETIGVKFGHNLNAYTAFDETVYNINEVPVDVKGAADSALLILADWSQSLLLRQEDIDKERKIIHEEWRTRRDVNSRMIDSIAPVIFNNSKYAERMPIGLMSVVDNFERQALVDYYHKWYRPDLQAIIVVGDIDAKEMEAKLKEYFEGFPKPENPAKRVYELIPDNKEPLVAIAADKEMSTTNIFYIFKRNPFTKDVKENQMYPMIKYMLNCITSMLNNRLAELLEKPNPPFAVALANDGPFFGTQGKDAFQFIAISRPGQSKRALQTLLEEVERVKRFGFTQSELEVVNKDLLSSAEKMMNEKDKQASGVYISRYINHFLRHEPMHSFQEEYEMLKTFSSMIAVKDINAMVQNNDFFTDENQVVAVMSSLKDKPTIPSEKEIKQMIAAAKELKIEPYKDNEVLLPLLSQEPTPGKITKEEKDGETYIWTLSNNAKLIFVPTNFKDDEIIMTAEADGGTSDYSELSVPDYKSFSEFYNVGGLGEHSQTNLTKVLSGKNISADMSIGNYTRKLVATSGKKDLESMMQLAYLEFTSIRKDTAAFLALQDRYKGFIANAKNNPNVIYNDSVSRVIYLDDPRFQSPSVDELEQLNYDNLIAVYQKHVANAADYTFFVVGNTDVQTLKPLVEKYIASLPGSQKSEPALKEIPTRKGIYALNFKRALDTHKATTSILYAAELPYTPDLELKMQLLSDVLNLEYIEEIREKLGGTYGASVSKQVREKPTPLALLAIRFESDVERRTELVNRMMEVIEDLKANGPKEEYLEKSKKYLLKDYQDGLKKNISLLNKLRWKYIKNYDYDAHYQELLEKIDANAIKEFAVKFFEQQNRIEVSMSDSSEQK